MTTRATPDVGIKRNVPATFVAPAGEPSRSSHRRAGPRPIAEGTGLEVTPGMRVLTESELLEMRACAASGRRGRESSTTQSL